MADEEVIFNVEEAAEFARVSPAVIRRWFDEGLRHMPTVAKVAAHGPRREIVRRSALLAFIEAREVRGKAQALEGKGAEAKPAASTYFGNDKYNLMGRNPRGKT